jgi:hypothetical protein
MHETKAVTQRVGPKDQKINHHRLKYQNYDFVTHTLLYFQPSYDPKQLSTIRDLSVDTLLEGRFFRSSLFSG